MSQIRSSASIREETGEVVYRDSWDVLVFPSEPPPRFSSTTAEGEVSSPPSVVLASITASKESPAPIDEVAFDLFTASMRSAHMADVRLVLLVMAIECLVERVQRPQSTCRHIDQMVKVTVENDALGREERESLANAVRGLKWESTRRATRRLARQLDRDRYQEEPTALIQEAFDLRNALVHGRGRPDLDRVRFVGANLERLVGDLIAGPAVVEEVHHARAEEASRGRA